MVHMFGNYKHSASFSQLSVTWNKTLNVAVIYPKQKKHTFTSTLSCFSRIDFEVFLSTAVIPRSHSQDIMVISRFSGAMI